VLCSLEFSGDIVAETPFKCKKNAPCRKAATASAGEDSRMIALLDESVDAGRFLPYAFKMNCCICFSGIRKRKESDRWQVLFV
jgi:hypothetical protein